MSDTHHKQNPAALNYEFASSKPLSYININIIIVI